MNARAIKLAALALRTNESDGEQDRCRTGQPSVTDVTFGPPRPFGIPSAWEYTLGSTSKPQYFLRGSRPWLRMGFGGMKLEHSNP